MLACLKRYYYFCNEYIYNSFMTDNRIIGREYEQHILKNICEEKGL